MTIEIGIEDGATSGDRAFFEEIADTFYAEANGRVDFFKWIEVRRGTLWNGRDVLFDLGCEFTGIRRVMDKTTIDE